MGQSPTNQMSKKTAPDQAPLGSGQPEQRHTAHQLLPQDRGHCQHALADFLRHLCIVELLACIRHMQQRAGLVAASLITSTSCQQLLWSITLLGWMPTFTVALLTFSRVMRSTWITHFFLYTATTLPSRPCRQHDFSRSHATECNSKPACHVTPVPCTLHAAGQAASSDSCIGVWTTVLPDTSNSVTLLSPGRLFTRKTSCLPIWLPQP